jgi:hypothetical protein
MQLVPQLDLDVSALKFNDESVRLIVRSLALEGHYFALSRGISSQSIEGQLHLVFGVIDGKFGDLLDFVDVPASGTACIGGFTFGFSNIVYRSLALAAQDAVVDAFDGDADV